jgi:hypothetical protein
LGGFVVFPLALAQSSAADRDGCIGQFDAVANAAAGRGWTKTAMALVGRLSAARAALVADDCLRLEYNHFLGLIAARCIGMSSIPNPA